MKESPQYLPSEASSGITLTNSLEFVTAVLGFLLLVLAATGCDPRGMLVPSADPEAVKLAEELSKNERAAQELARE